MQHFFDSSRSHGNVVFNFRGLAINDISAFAAGYHAAGKTLVSKMAASRGYRDYEGYPILFLYRHALELYLKAIVYRGAQLLGMLSNKKPNTEKLFTNHRLRGLLPTIEAIFRGMAWKWDFEVSGLRSFDDFVELIKEIEMIDPLSYYFRYPVNATGEAAVPKHHIVNVIDYGKKMDSVLDFLSGVVAALEERWDDTAEVMYRLRELLDESAN